MDAFRSGGRIAALDRARTFITLLVVLHHSVLNFTYFGNGDKARWLGFDLVVLFNDSFFMATMFFISGLFVWGELDRKGTARFMRDRAWRLGIPFLVSIFILMPLAYYPTFLRYYAPGTMDFSFMHFWWRTITIGPWPSGPAWFLWVLLALDAIAVVVWRLAPRLIATLGRMTTEISPLKAFAVFLAITLMAYVPLRMLVGDAAWLAYGPIPIQTSRILLYASSFLAGVMIGSVDLRTGLLAENGALARRWPLWLTMAAMCYAAILALVYVKRGVLGNPDPLPPWWNASYSVAFASYSATMTFAVSAIMLCFANTRWTLLDAMRPQAYGIFLVHYIFIIWLQYAVYDLALSAAAKFAIVFVGTLAGSWMVTAALRRVALIQRMI